MGMSNLRYPTPTEHEIYEQNLREIRERVLLMINSAAFI